MTATTKVKIPSSSISSSTSSSNEDIAVSATLDDSYSDHNDDDDDDNSSDIHNWSNLPLKTTSIRKRFQSKQQHGNNMKHNENIEKNKFINNDKESYYETMKSTSQQRQQQRQQSPFLLIICASGICTCYLYFGIVQERLFSKGSSNNEMKNCGNTTTFMLVLSCITNVIVSMVWIFLEEIIFSSKSRSIIEDMNKKNDSIMLNKKERLNHPIFFQCKFCYIKENIVQKRNKNTCTCAQKYNIIMNSKNIDNNYINRCILLLCSYDCI